MSSSKVAVVIPCYNSEKHITQTIESVFNQTYKNFHVILGNDGSNDNTELILADYSDRVSVFSHPDRGNHGQAATYNLCLRNIDTEYIAFLDHDDIWHEKKLEKQVYILDKYKDVGLVYTNGYVIDSSNEILYDFFNRDHKEKNRLGAILLDCYIRTPSAVMVRSDILKKTGGFSDGLTLDHDMWIRISELTKFYYINEKLFSYRIHRGQISQKSTERMWREAFGTLQRALDRYPYPPSLRRKRLAVIHYRLGQIYINNRIFLAMYHFIISSIHDPFRAFYVFIKAITKNKRHVFLINKWPFR